MKKLSIAAALVLSVSLLGGCGAKFDAAAYTKALLDNSYKNDSTDFVAMKIGTAEEAADLYEQGLDSEVDAMLSAAGSVTEEQAEGFRQVFADILKGAKYTVDGAEKQDDGGYVVTITYEQMQVFTPAIQAYAADIEDMSNEWADAAAAGGEIPAEEEMTAAVVDSLRTCFEEAIPNATYAEPQTTTIKIDLVNNVYTPNENDLANLEMVMFDLEEGMNQMQ